MKYYIENGQRVPYKINGEIHFSKNSQIALWEGIILGNLSDGYWTNYNIDWKFWYEMKPILFFPLGWKRYDNYVPITYSVNTYNLLESEGKENLIYYAKFGTIPVLDREEMNVIYNHLNHYELDDHLCITEDNLIQKFGSIKFILQSYSSSKYEEENLFEDLEVINTSMKTSLRKIGYLD
jgi:hypothetical protein